MLAVDAEVAAAVVADIGDGPPVVLLHGVGFGPPSWGDVAGVLAAEHRVLVVQRPAAVPGGVALQLQAAAVATVVRDALGDVPVTVAGGSGGATLGLALAARHPSLVGAAVLHEPLAGRNAPALHEAVTAEARALRTGERSAEEWLAGLVGVDAWAALPDAARVDAATAGAALIDEVTPFVSWEPSAAELGGARGSTVVTTVGGRSSDARRSAAAALAGIVGAHVVVLEHVGHLVQIEAPRAFAALVHAASRAAGGTP